MTLPVNDLYEFDGYVVDRRKRRLLRRGEPVSLTPKAFETLLVLVAAHGRVLEKDELMEAVWPDTSVEESALSRNIYLLRKALGESPDDHRYIVTVPGRGYSFVGSVNGPWAAVPAPDPLADESGHGPTVAPPASEVVVATRTRATIVTEEVAEPVVSAHARWRMRSLALAAVVVTTTVVLAIGVWRASKVGAGAVRIQSLAVLPFRLVPAVAGDEYLGLGMADVLITRLHHLRAIIVRPTSAIYRYADGSQDALSVGKSLRVEAVLEGTIQRNNDRVRVTARLLSVPTGQPLWAEQFDETLTDIFAIEDRISTKLANALALELTGEERRHLSERRTTNSRAYQAYLRGRYFWSRWTKASLEKAIGSFEEALAADPVYAPALSGLADSYTLLGYLGFMRPRDAFPRSEAAALAALKIDDTLGEAHVSLAKTRLFYQWDWAGAERELERGIALDPNYADAHGMYGTYLIAVGRFDDALAERLRALELDPATPLTATMVGWVHFYAGKYDRAVEAYRQALDLDPSFVQARMDLGNALYQQGKYDEAIEEYLHGRSLSGASREAIAAARQSYQAGGRLGYWRHQLEVWEQQRKEGRGVGSWATARAYVEVGDRDRAFEWLEQACEERASLLVFLKHAPMFAPLRDDPRFAGLVRRIGVP